MSSCSNSNNQSELIALYTKLAEQPEYDFGWSKGKANAQQLGYSDEWLNCLPDVVWESAAAVGNPFKLGQIGSGQTVLDVGCGAGADACVAALHVGNTGKVIGIDCTPAMISKAREIAMQSALGNIEFYEADIINLPISDNSIDVVISNGAINWQQSLIPLQHPKKLNSIQLQPWKQNEIHPDNIIHHRRVSSDWLRRCTGRRKSQCS